MMETPTQATASPLAPAKPLLPRARTSVWTAAGQLRDEIYGTFVDVCREAKLDALVHKSAEFSYPSWALLEAWLPTGERDVTNRVRLLVSIEPMAQMRHEHVFTVTCLRDGREKVRGPLARFRKNDAAAWARYTLGLSKKGPAWRAQKLRKFPWEIWRPRNKPRHVGVHPLNWAAGALLVAGIGLVLLEVQEPFLILAAFGAAAGLKRIATWSKRLTVSGGRPLAEPRNLRLLDSWQTILAGLGESWRDVRDRLRAEFAAGAGFGIAATLEQISYLGPDGKQEREQIVLSQGRGLVFVHIYPYGSELFVGWDAHLNYGQWGEKRLATAYDKRLGEHVHVNTVVPTTARVSEYDLIDLNSLTEWVHARVVHLVSRVLDERKLDQEVDFKIVRGERQSLLRDQSAEPRKRRFKRSDAAA